MSERLSHKAIRILAIGIVLVAFGGAHAQSLDISEECAAESLEEARDYFHRTWFEEADRRLTAYLAECPDSALAQAYAAITDSLLFRDNAHSTRLAGELAGDSSGGISLMSVALASFATGDLADAESTLLEFLEDHPDDAYAHHVLGFTLIDQGRPDEGRVVLEQLLERQPDYYPAYNHLAYALLAQEYGDAALSAADAFVDADPGNPSAWDTRAHVLWETGRREEAIASLARSVVLDERFAYGLRHLGDLLLDTGDIDAAGTAWERARSAGSLGDYGSAFADSLDERLNGLDE